MALATAVGLWFSARLHAVPGDQAQKQRTEEVVAQDRLLVDALWSSIETIKTRALSLEQIRDTEARGQAHKASTRPDGSILHWAELEVRQGKIGAVLQAARNPSFQPAAGTDAFESYYLEAARGRIRPSELEENGVAVLRIKQDAGRSQEWLAFAFPGMITREQIAAQRSGAVPPVVLALVDPAEVFPVFSRWTARSEVGNLRGYLVGGDGFVIAHSQYSYVASNFASTQVFAQGVREMMQGQLRSGAGVYKAIDQVLVTAAFARPGTLPLGAVVERVNPRDDSGSVLASVWALAMLPPSEPLGALALILVLASCSALAVQAALAGATMRARDDATAPDADDAEDAAEFESELAAAAAPALAMPACPPEASAAPLTGAEGVETLLARDLLAKDADGPAAQAQRSARVLVAQFETEVQNVQDPRLVAQSLADTASRLVGAPALFFSYHESLKACLLQAHAGLAPGTSTDALSFRLSEAMLARIARYRKEGRTASLADDAQLMLLLARRLGSPRFEAWPVTGPGGRLLGALVVLGAASLQPESAGLGHVMKISGHLYEQLKREAAHAPEGGGRA